MKTIVNRIGILGMIMLLIAGCSELSSDNYGTLKIDITDAPFPIDLIDSANVTITKVEARIKGDSSGAEFTTLYEESQTFNLLELRNGVTANMTELEVPVGEIDLIRIYVEEASLTLTNGDSYSVKVPSGSQTGIKVFINPAITIAGGLTSELLLDFSLEKSFVLKGNMNTPAGIKGFNFKPVIRAVNNSTAGTIAGVVMDTSLVALGKASLWVEQDSIISTAITDSTGFYAFPGLEAGSYMVSATAENHDTVTIEDVPVQAANRTELNFELTKLTE